MTALIVGGSAVIGQVASHDMKLHKTLSQLVENFDYPAILNLLQMNQPEIVTRQATCQN